MFLVVLDGAEWKVVDNMQERGDTRRGDVLIDSSIFRSNHKIIFVYETTSLTSIVQSNLHISTKEVAHFTYFTYIIFDFTQKFLVSDTKVPLFDYSYLQKRKCLEISTLILHSTAILSTAVTLSCSCCFIQSQPHITTPLH